MTDQPQTRRTIPWRLIVAAVAVILLAVLVFQNAQTVTFEIFFWEVESRLIWMLLLVGLLGFLAGLLLPRFRR